VLEERVNAMVTRVTQWVCIKDTIGRGMSLLAGKKRQTTKEKSRPSWRLPLGFAVTALAVVTPDN